MAPPFPTDRPALVHRLRTAGCVYAEDEADLLLAAADTPAALADLTARRVAGEPLEYLLGWAEFCGLRIAVDEGVFVPRARTALLVEAAAEVTGPAPAVIDLCCGSGATTVALAHRLAPRWLAAADIDPAAVACARRNVVGLNAEVYEGDLFDPLPRRWRGRLDLVVANAPYVPTDAVALMPPEARLHEAPVALDGGPDGLSVLRRVGSDAADWLAPGGHLVVEVGTTQVDALCESFQKAGLSPTVHQDETRDATALTARRP
ncbi:putative protein N(5)-glutamine methyltransferase [Micromonospora sp. M51]|uniref:putative protein N(5)-glutamine methyltransferase n=1 Tax=Micromonospora sp. M51 TaxID=2824889 RepID=UPI001B365609|nr:putative protein N(5)-glutamine methyltransferase [Micromonospora sp. M51]MBQ1013190.1 putative protein N(5)-glutamine methyltransferase [Micromonospora sp. M51]